MDKYSSTEKNDGSGIVFFLGASFIIGGIIIALIPYLDIKNARSPEPPIPAGIPEGVPVLFSTTIESGEDRYLIKLTGEEQITVEFDGHASIKKLWNGSNPLIQVNLPGYELNTASTREETWDNLLISQAPGNQEFTPWLRTKITFDKNFLHNWVSLTATLSVIYPVSSGTTFANNKVDLFREIYLFGISDDEYEAMSKHILWQEAVENSNKTTVIGEFICSGIVFLFGCFWIFKGIIYKYNERRRYPSW